MAINPMVSGSEGKVHATISQTPGEYSSISLSILNNNTEIPENGTVSTEINVGQVAYISNLIKVVTNKIGKYYIGIQAASDSSNNLTGINYGATIDGVGDNVSPRNFRDNTWGYALTDRTSIIDEYLTYSTLPSYDSSASPQYASTQNPNDGEYQLKLVFAANIRADKPADHYQATALISLAAEAREVTTLREITYMQDVTPEICSDTPVANTSGENQYQLIDKRDSKVYWVAKLNDQRCWMTQNLDLDLSTNKTLTNLDTDLQGDITSYTPVYSTATIADSSTILADNVGQRSWSLGDYRLVSPTVNNNCGEKKNSVADCSGFTSYTTPTAPNGDSYAHYILGNHYQWNTATAGTGGTISSGQASSSICPRGWRLPTGASGGEFQAMTSAEGILYGQVSKIVSPPFYGARSGYVAQGAFLFANAGNNGVYWSSTPSGDANPTSAYDLLFYNNADTVMPDRPYTTRQTGQSIRCVVR